MTGPVHIPAGLPVLSRGVHLDATTGGCFMEYASLLAGEPWSDRPRCTHPALAQLARLVNDAADAAARQRLVPMIPEVLGTRCRDAAVTPMLVLLCWQHYGALPAGVRLSAHRSWAERRLRGLAHGGIRAGWCRITDPAYRDGPANQAMAGFVEAIAGPDSRGGDRLVALLADAISLVRGAAAARPAAATLGRDRAVTTRQYSVEPGPQHAAAHAATAVRR